MRVLATGGSGYIGQAVIGALVDAGHEVVALARSDDSVQKVIDAGAHALRGELSRVDELRAAARDADGVIYLGASSPDVDLAACQAMQEGVGDGPFVFTGGVWVYGNTDGVVDENAPLAPPPLVAWRVENTNAIMEAAESGGRPVLVMPGGVYGDAGGLLMGSIVGPAAARGHASYIGEGDNHWALVHRHDIAQLYVLALGAPPRSRFCGVGSSEATMRQLAEATGSASAARSMSLRDARECFGPLADALALDQQFTAQHARDVLGWVPDGPTPLEYLAAL